MTMPLAPKVGKPATEHTVAPLPFRLTPLARHLRSSLLPGVMLGLQSLPAYAGPEGGQVVAGQGSIAAPNATTTVINQQSQRLALDWQSFNVKQNELVQFNQPGRNAEALNRIFDQNPSQIFGRINANGRVVLANPNGMFFGPTAKVNVNGLVAAGLNVKVDDFMAGRYRLEGAPDGAGLVVNQGVLAAANGGDVTLVGKAVRNEGVILATAGRVNLAAGDKLTLDFDGDGLLRFTVDEAVVDNAQALDAAVTNTGHIAAAGGEVVLAASAAKDVFSKAINNAGIIRAARVDHSGGVVRLVGMGPNASVLNTGEIDVSAATPGATGGRIDVAAANIENQGLLHADATTANAGTVMLAASATAAVTGDGVVSAASAQGRGGTVSLTGATVKLSGNAVVAVAGGSGGGVALVGGDYQGKNAAVRNAEQTFVGGNAAIHADATVAGKGGKVIVWADHTTEFHGTITARGGAAGGDGGFVETSGKDYLDMRGLVNAASPLGQAGEWLLDPRNVTLLKILPSPADNSTGGSFAADGTFTPTADNAQADIDQIVTALQGGTNVTITTGGTGLQDGDITLQDALTVNLSSARLLTLQAADDIFINNAITATGNALSLVFTANSDAIVGGNVAIGAAITTNNGAFTVSGVDITNNVNINTGTGNVKFTATGAISNALGGAALNMIGGTLEMIAATGIGTSGNPFSTAGVTGLAARTTTGGIFLSNSSSNITVQTVGGTTGLSATTSGDIRLINTGGSIAVQAAVVTNAGNGITLQAGTGLTSTAAGTLTTVNASVLGNSGAIDLDVTAAGAISLAGAIDTHSVDVVAVAAGSGGAVTIDAADGPIAVGDITTLVGNGALIGGTAGNVTITGADTGNDATHDVTLNGQITASAGTNGTAGTVSITADNSILDGNGATVNITADTATLTANGAAGQIDTTNVLETAVSHLTASAAGGLSISNSNTLLGVQLTTTAGVATFTVNGSLTIVGSWVGGGFDLTADDVAIDAAATINAGTGSVKLIPNNGRTVGVGVAVAQQFDVTDAEIDRITAGSLTIGATNSGAMLIGTVTPAATNIDLSLLSGSTIDEEANDATTKITTTGTLTLGAAGKIGDNADANAPLDIAVTGLNASTSAGGIFLRAGSALSIVDRSGSGGFAGVRTTANNAAIDLTVAAGGLLLNAPIVTHGVGNLTLNVTGTITEGTADAIPDLVSGGTLTLSATGTIGDSGSNQELDLDVATVAATTSSGGIFLRETDTAIANGLTIGGTGIQTTGANAPIKLVVASGNLVLNEDITANGAGNVDIRLNSSGAAVATDNALDNIASTSGTITIVADNLNLALATITTAGNIQLLPFSAGRAINLGTGTGGMDLTDTELDLFSTAILVLGDAVLQTGAINLTSSVDTANTTQTQLLTAGAITSTNAANVFTENHLVLTGTNIGAATVFGVATAVLKATAAGATANDDIQIKNGATAVTIDLNTAGGDVVFTSQAAVSSSAAMTAKSFDLATSSGDLTIGHNLTTIGAAGAGAITLTASGAGATVKLDPGTAADITIQTSNGNTITLAGEIKPVIDLAPIGTDGDGVVNIVTSGLVLNLDAAGDGGTLGLGDDAVANAVSSIEFSDAEMDSLAALGGGTLTFGGATQGNILFDRLTSFGTNNLGLLTSGSINDTNDAIDPNALTTTGTLTLQAGAVGDLNDGLTLAVGKLALTTAATRITNAGALHVLDSTVTGALQLTTAAGSLTLDAIAAGGQNVTLNTAGGVLDGNTTGVNVSATDLNVTAVSGINLDTNLTSLTASNGSGAITLREADGITLTNVQNTNGAITVTAGGAVTATNVTVGTDLDANDIGITATAGNIEVGTISTGGANGDVTLTANTVAGQSVLDANGDSAVTAEVLTLVAGNGGGAIGSAANHLKTTTLTIAATGGTGGVFVTESNGASFTATAQGAGAIDLSTTTGLLTLAGATNTGTGTITLSSGDGITLNAALGGADDGAITIMANTDGAGAQGFTQNAGGSIQTGDTGAGAVSIAVNTVTGTGGAALGADITTGAGGTIAINTGTLGGSITRTGGTLSAGTATLTAGNGAIGAVGTEVVTNVGTLNASAGNGGIALVENDGVNLANVVATNGAITVTAGGAVTATNVTVGTDLDANDIGITATAGNIEVGTISTGGANGDVTLTANTVAGQSVLDANGDSAVTAEVLTLVAGNGGGAIGSAANHLKTTTLTIAATGGTGGVFVTESNGASFTATAQGAGAIDLSTTTGLLTLAGATNTGTGTIMLSSGDGITLNAALGGADDGAITIAANTDGAGAQGFTQNAGGSIQTGDTGAGAVSIAVNTVTGTGGAALGADITTGAGGTIAINTGTLGTSITRAGGTLSAGTATLTAGNGAIGAAGAGAAVATDVGSITATAGNGDIFIAESNAVTLTSLTTTDGAISVTAGGTMTVTAVAANDVGNDQTHDVTLNATAGNLVLGSNAITADNDAVLSALAGDITASGGTTQVTASHDIRLAAQTNIGDITSFAAGTGTALGISFGNQLTNASVTATGGEINLNVGNSLSSGGTVAAGAIVVSAAGTAQAILQSAGDLNLAAASNAFVTTAGDSLGLISGGTLIMPGSGLSLANAVNVNLLLRGATDIIDDGTGDANPRTLSITAQDLSFTSGPAGGTTTLSGDLATLTAAINNAAGASLIVADSNAIDLVAVNVQNGGLTVTAGGAVTIRSVVLQTDLDVNDVDISTTAGNIEVDSISTGGVNSDVVLTANTVAGQSILDNDANSAIVADQVSLNAAQGAGAIGASAKRIHTTANTVIANGGSGGVFLTETNGASFTATAQGTGAIDLLSTSGTLAIGGVTSSGTGTITLSSGDAVTLNAALGGADDGIVSIAANTDGAGAQGFTQNAGATIQTGNTGANAISIAVNTATGTGAAVVGADISTGAGGTITLTTGTLGGSISTTGGTLNAGTTTLSTGNGAIGANGTELSTNVTTLNASAGNGGVFIIETDAVTLGNVLATGTGTNDVAITNQTGNLSVGLVQADDKVTLTSVAGQILEAGSDAAADVVATNVVLAAATGIANLELNATAISADTTSGSVVFDNLATAVTTLNSLSGGSATVSFVGSLTLANNANVINMPGGAASITIDANDNLTTQLDLGTGSFTFGSLSLIGGTDGNDTLFGQNQVNRWQITGGNTGTLNDVTAGYTLGFSAFGSLRGAANQADTFTFANTATLTGVIQGGLAAATDIIDWTAYTSARNVTLNAAGGVDGFNGQEASLNGGAADGFLNIDTIVVGQNLAHSLTGLNTDSAWTFTATARTYVDSASARTLDLAAIGPGANGTGFRNFTGGSGQDTFKVGAAIEAGDATDTPVALTANFDGGGNDDTFTLVGPSGGSVLTGNITGGTGNDTLNFGFPPIGAPPTAENDEDSRVVGTVDLGAGTDTINFSGSDAFQKFLVSNADVNGNTGTLTGFGPDTGALDLISGGFAGVDAQIGNTKGPLVGNNIANLWIITGINQGTLNGAAFTNFQLIGGTDTDIFELRAGGRIDFGVDGQLGDDTVRGDTTALNTTTYAIQLQGANSGTIDANGDGVLATSFTGIESVQGGINDDVFTFQNNTVQFAGQIDGRQGKDSLNLSALTGPRTVSLTAAGAIDGYDGNEAALASGFKNFNGLIVAGAGNSLVSPGVDTNAGNATDNFFFINAANAGTLSDADAHDASASARLSFSGFDTLVGGSADDEFEFSSDGVTHGNVQNADGGAGQDRLDLAPLGLFVNPVVQITGPEPSPGDGFVGRTLADVGDPVTVIANPFHHMNAVTGGLGDQFNPSNQNTRFTITGVDTFTIDTSTIAFQGFTAIGGGSGGDEFIFTPGGRMSNGIDGGTGTNTFTGSANGDAVTLSAASTGTITIGGLVTDFQRVQIFNGAGGIDTLDLSGLVGPVTVNLAAGTATGTGGISNFESFIGSGAAATLIALNRDNRWNIDNSVNPDSGNITDSVGAGSISYRSFANLVGGTLSDMFFLEDTDAISGTVNAGGGTDRLSYTTDSGGATNDTRDSHVDLTAGTATGIGGLISGFEEFVGGGGANDLTAGTGNDAWVITGANSGSLNGFSFANFQTIDGGAGTDTFTLNAGGSVSGTIRGGADTDTLIGNGFTNNWTISGNDAGSLNGNQFQQIENLTAAGDANGTLAFTASAGISGQITAGQVTLNTAAINTGGTGLTIAGNVISAGAQSITTSGTGLAIGGSFTTGGGLTANSGGGNVTVGGQLNSGGLTTITTGGGNVALGSLTSAQAMTLTTGAGVVTIAGPTTIGAGGLTANSGGFTLNGPLQTAGAVAVASGAGSIAINGAVNTGGNAFQALASTAGGNSLNVGAITAASVNIASSDSTLDAVTTTGDQNYSGATNFQSSLSGGNLVFNGASSFLNATTNLTGTSFVFNGPVTFAGDTLLEASSNLVAFNGAVLGSGSLDINPTPDTDLFIDLADGAGHIAADQFGGFTGHLIIGGILNPFASPAEDAAVVELNANRISILNDFATGGDVTFLASNIDLFADVSADGAGGGQVTMLAVGDTQGRGDASGDITAPTSGTVTISGGKAVLIANNDIVNNANIRLDLDGGPLLVAVSSTANDPTFDSSSSAESVNFDPTTLRLITSLTNPIGVQAVQVVFSNPAAALTGLQNVQFIDIGLFEEELTLFGVIGNGIALSLDQCEEAEGCAPNIAPEELDRLIDTLQRRIAELGRRQTAGGAGAKEAERLLAGYRQQLADFQTYKQQLHDYQEAQEDAGDNFEELEGSDVPEELAPETPQSTPATPATQPSRPAPKVESPGDEAFDELEPNAPAAKVKPAPKQAAPARPAKDEFEELDEEIEKPIQTPKPKPATPASKKAPAAAPQKAPDEFEELEEEIDDSLILGLLVPANVNTHRGAVQLASNGRVVWTGGIALPRLSRRF